LGSTLWGFACVVSAQASEADPPTDRTSRADAPAPVPAAATAAAAAVTGPATPSTWGIRSRGTSSAATAAAPAVPGSSAGAPMRKHGWAGVLAGPPPSSLPWEFQESARRLLRTCGERGDVQMCVALVMVLGEAVAADGKQVGRAHPAHICAGTALTLPTSAPAPDCPGSPRPHPPTSAPGPG
jgi:hypothetical protein